MRWEDSGAAFPVTRWSLVLAAAGDTSGHRASAIIDLYWPAVYAYLRRRKYSRDQASELTQAFFADVFLGRDLLRTADASRGRLRSLVVAALKNYLVDAARREAARGGDRLATLESAWLDREESLLTADASEPDAAFERRWGLAQVEEALRRCEQHFHRISKRAHWKAFEARVLRPSLRAFNPPPLDQLVDELGFRSPADVAAAVQVVKRRLAALLEEVAAEVGDQPDASNVSHVSATARTLVPTKMPANGTARSTAEDARHGAANGEGSIA